MRSWTGMPIRLRDRKRTLYILNPEEGALVYTKPWQESGTRIGYWKLKDRIHAVHGNQDPAYQQHRQLQKGFQQRQKDAMKALMRTDTHLRCEQTTPTAQALSSAAWAHLTPYNKARGQEEEYDQKQPAISDAELQKHRAQLIAKGELKEIKNTYTGEITYIKTNKST